MTEERLAELMVTVVDGVASPADREELMAFIADKPDLRRELDAHQALKAVTDGWVDRLELDLVEDRMREDGTNVWLWNLGIVLFLPNSNQLRERFRPTLVFGLFTAALLLVSVLNMSNVKGFLYFQF